MVRTTRTFGFFGKKTKKQKQKQKQNNKTKQNKNKNKKQKKNGLFKTIFDKAFTPFWNTFL